MSAHYSNYANIDGNTAFLAGAVSTYADAYLCEILPKYWALEADVIDTEISNLCDSIRKRLRDYLSEDNADIIRKIDGLDFGVEQLSGELPQIVHELFDRYKEKHVPNESELINRFLADIRYQLGDAKGIYSIEGALNERITAALSEFYTYIVFAVLFIEYDGYIVMLVFGSDE